VFFFHPAYRNSSVPPFLAKLGEGRYTAMMIGFALKQAFLASQSQCTPLIIIEFACPELTISRRYAKNKIVLRSSIDHLSNSAVHRSLQNLSLKTGFYGPFAARFGRLDSHFGRLTHTLWARGSAKYLLGDLPSTDLLPPPRDSSPVTQSSRLRVNRVQTEKQSETRLNLRPFA
jgi:hypothetical protein